ncbi:MAG: FAD-dependent oxidoreductase, partial [Gemmatimonadales bacterium]
ADRRGTGPGPRKGPVMSEENQASSGPDLSAGIPSADLQTGVPIEGHVGTDPVLVVRQGGKVFALDGRCTHYGAPLAGGLVAGETIRCPWHHACFSLRTGGVLDSPAFNSLGLWNVVTEGDRIRINGRVSPSAGARRSMPGPSSVVIAGAGAAGTITAETLRREGYDGPIRAIDPDRDAPYDRPNLSKDYLAGIAPEEWLPLQPAALEEGPGVERLYSRIQSISPGDHTVVLEDGATLEYGALLLATGATPRTLSIPGSNLPHVHVLRSLADCRQIIEQARSASRAVVVGSGFLGMESAASLRTRGLEVTVIGRDEVPLSRILGPDLGGMLLDLHRAHDVEFRLRRSAGAITPDSVTLDDGQVVEADLVLVAIGVDPNITLAGEAGLAADKGITVDRMFRTSEPDIWAVGDAARYPDPATGRLIRIEHWAVAQQQGRVAARNILGMEEPYTRVPFFWTAHWDRTVNYVGHASAWDRHEAEGDPRAGDGVVRLYEGEDLRAVASVGRDRESLLAELELHAAYPRP